MGIGVHASPETAATNAGSFRGALEDSDALVVEEHPRHPDLSGHVATPGVQIGQQAPLGVVELGFDVPSACGVVGPGREGDLHRQRRLAVQGNGAFVRYLALAVDDPRS